MENIKAIVVNGPNGQQEYGIEDAVARENVQEIVEGAPEELDSFKEAFEKFKEGSDALTVIAEDVERNAEAIAAEATRATEAEEEISHNAIAADSMGYSTTTTDVSLEFETLDGKSSGSVTIPAATAEKAGVMTAEDKNELSKAITDIKSNAAAIVEEKERAEKALAAEVEKLKNGDTIVAQAREIHSRNGKTISDSFLARTTAGSGTIGDGVATLKSVGGNIVKNLVDKDWVFVVNLGKWQTMGNTTHNVNGG